MKLDELSAAQRELLAKRLLDGMKPQPRAPEVPRCDVASGSISSFWQDVVLAWERRRRPSTTWSSAHCLRLIGELDEVALTESIRATLDRQECLRHVFHRDPAIPVRLCTPHQIPIESVDLSGVTEDEVKKLTRSFVRTPFPFDGTPLVRFLLIRRGPDEHLLYVVWHHIVHDAPYFRMLAEQILGSYSALCEGRTPQLPQLPFRYTDFAVWERRRLETVEGAAAIAAARERLRVIPPMELPITKPRGADSTTEGVLASFTLSAADSARFEALCQKSHVTLFMGAVAFIALALSRFCNSDHVTALSPLSTRSLEGTRDLAGSFHNYLSLHVSLEENPTVRELLARVANAVGDAQEHAKVPAALAYETPDVYGHPLSRVLVNLPGGGVANYSSIFSFAGLEGIPQHINLPMWARTELVIAVLRSGDEQAWYVTGATTVFDAPTIADFTSRLGNLVRSADLEGRVRSLVW